MRIEGQQFESEYLVLDHLEGLHSEVSDMVSAMPTASVKDYENILARLDENS